MAKQRRGMIIKNTDTRPVEIKMATRTIVLRAGEQKLITADEVRDKTLREKLQVRAINIVRPATPAEEAELAERLGTTPASEDEA